MYRAFSYPNYVDIRDNNQVFSSLAALNMAMVGIQEGDTTRRAFAAVVSSNYFSTLGVTLLNGRAFLPEEEKPGSELTVDRHLSVLEAKGRRSGNWSASRCASTATCSRWSASLRKDSRAPRRW